MKGNFFKVYRTLLDSDLWLAEPFTRGQAWIDLIGLANYDRTETFYRGELQIIERGQIKTSCVWLANRWGHNRKWVNHFLKQLETLKMVTTKSTPNGTTITIENYALYQDVGTTKRTTEGTTAGTTEGTTAGTQKKKYKENKESDTQKNIVKSETVDGWLIETDVNGREYARKVDANA